MMSKFIAVALLVISAAAQSSGDTPSCASKLVGCVNYLNATTTPPPSCCSPLKEAVTNEKECLCRIYNDPSLIQAFHINITQALNLPKVCRIDTGGSSDICKGLAKSPSGSSTPSGSSPPGNAGLRIRGAGLMAILIVFGACLTLY